MAVKFSEWEIASYRGRSKFPLLTIQVGTVPPPRGAPDLLSTSRKHNVGWQTFQRSVTLINARVLFWNNDLTRPTLGLVLPSSPSLFHWAGCRKIKSFAGRCVCVCFFLSYRMGLSFPLSSPCFGYQLHVLPLNSSPVRPLVIVAVHLMECHLSLCVLMISSHWFCIGELRNRTALRRGQVFDFICLES